MKQTTQLYIIFFLFFILHTEGVATPILERTVTLQVQNKPLGEVLKNISEQANCQFAYNTNIIDKNKRISLNVFAEKVRNVLKDILGNNYQFKEKDNYLIIQRLKQDEQLISGYVRDKNTGEKLKNVTVYDKKTLVSATTDSSGYYEIITRKPIEQLSIARVNYGDTILQVKSLNENTPQYIDLSQLPTPEKLSDKEDDKDGFSINIKPRKVLDKYEEHTLFSNYDIANSIKYVVSTFERANDLNITESLKRRWQVSLAPYLGTNLGLSGSVINKFSFNATVGYSKGSNGLEIGGIGNINRDTMKGTQIGGIFNIVNGNAQGLQIAGILNRTKHVSGLQIAGITNSSDKILRGVQIGGINNYAKYANSYTYQIAGIVNKVGIGKTAIQIAIINNEADTVGVQIGLINNANHLKGLQIGLINKADTASGILLGLINVVKKGYHVFEVSSNDVTKANIAYKTGTHYFYTIYTLGGQPILNGKPYILTAGGGIGSFIRFTKHIGITFDATIHRYWIETTLDNKGGLVKLSPALNIQLAKKLSIAVSPVWNAYYFNMPKQTPDNLSLVKRHLIPSNATFKNDWATWWGWNVAMRF